MKKIVILLGVLMLCASPVYAISGVGFGIRGGFVQNYDNPGLDESSLPVDLKEMPMLGAHVVFGFIPVIDLEGSAEMAWKKKEFLLGDTKADFTVRDLSLNVTAKYKIDLMPVIKPYIGAGLGWHWLTYSSSLDEGPTFVLPVDENRLGYHGVGGVSLKFPAVPFELFAEYRYTHIMTEQEEFGTKGSHYTTLLGGITFGF
ncbi:MAG: porin family protein [candidate division Zixibacteria bacterium]|nr:porin family protein [candidate division Zixibacteria bacterium]